MCCLLGGRGRVINGGERVALWITEEGMSIGWCRKCCLADGGKRVIL